MEHLKVLFASPEALPFAKTGGLADVSGTLPRVLVEAGHTVVVAMPKYGAIPKDLLNGAIVAAEWELDWPLDPEPVRLLRLTPADSPVTYLFVESERYFERPSLYRDPATGKDYADNDERYILFCRALLEGLRRIGWAPDIIHANDWQTALLPTFLATLYKTDPFYAYTRSVLTIHNMPFQGKFPATTFAKLGLPEALFYPTGPFEFWGDVNFLKSAIWYVDAITTVSERYAAEIQSSPVDGAGLDGVLKTRAGSLFGILNGVDYDVWSPEKDRHIPYRYSPANLSGKRNDRVELINRIGLPLREDAPLIGMITRLSEQKGFDLIEKAEAELFAMNLQIVILGTGDEKYQKLLPVLERRYPDKLKAVTRHDEEMAHWIEAGADAFLMPSRYEPCGLNQMYSLRYGTVPIVRETGGLADSVVDVDADGATGTGFMFAEYEPEELLTAVRRMLATFPRKRIWREIMKRGMKQDFSWTRSAQKYINLYQNIVAR
ncbi:MAG: glycogen synthase GlgA [candidate division Zixibacteria bacterium]|nr:glycogen synthase GlgA [candidate division Zixibacteria bacterium]